MIWWWLGSIIDRRPLLMVLTSVSVPLGVVDALASSICTALRVPEPPAGPRGGDGVVGPARARGGGGGYHDELSSPIGCHRAGMTPLGNIEPPHHRFSPRTRRRTSIMPAERRILRQSCKGGASSWLTTSNSADARVLLVLGGVMADDNSTRPASKDDHPASRGGGDDKSGHLAFCRMSPSLPGWSTDSK